MRYFTGGALAIGILGACATAAEDTGGKTASRPVAIASAAPAPVAAAPIATASAKPASEKNICKQLKVMGSNMPMRQCMTEAEWDKYDKEGLEQTEEFRRNIQRSGANLPLGETRGARGQ